MNTGTPPRFLVYSDL